jgi:hypothetical protein
MKRRSADEWNDPIVGQITWACVALKLDSEKVPECGLRAGDAYHALASGMVQCASSRSRLAGLSLSLCPAHLSSWSCGRSQQLPLFSQPPSNFLRFAAENLYYATRCTPNIRRHVSVPSDRVQPRPRHSRGSSTSTRRERCPGSPRMMQASTGLLRCACARAWYAGGMRGGGRHACGRHACVATCCTVATGCTDTTWLQIWWAWKEAGDMLFDDWAGLTADWADNWCVRACVHSAWCAGVRACAGVGMRAWACACLRSCARARVFQTRACPAVQCPLAGRSVVAARRAALQHEALRCNAPGRALSGPTV